ncbi:MAG: tRNA pseudouridine(55) synthase TruB [Planctomycetaceae bacterium]|nr:tRNA pseudouridine(55) synthase TruB [Planctomycetaceae bacterium]
MITPGFPVSGIVVLKKPQGESSRATLNRLLKSVRSLHNRQMETLQNRKNIRTPRVGHAGTLDPLAEGVLVACVGEATKLIEAIQMLPKHYTGTFQLGVASDTEDIEGNVHELENPHRPTLDELRRAAARLTGRILQRPPVFSALKVSGKRAYRLARQGERVELAVREIDIYHLEVAEYDAPFVRLDIECGSGTYIRSIGRDLAESLGTGAVMTALIRDRIGPFQIENAAPPQLFDDKKSEEKSNGEAQDWLSFLLPVEQGVAHLSFVELNHEQATRLRHGLPLRQDELRIFSNGLQDLSSGLLAAFDDGTFDGTRRLVSLIEPTDDGWFRVKRNFSAPEIWPD